MKRAKKKPSPVLLPKMPTLRLYAERTPSGNWYHWRTAMPKSSVMSSNRKPLWYFIPIIVADARFYKVVPLQPKRKPQRGKKS